MDAGVHERDVQKTVDPVEVESGPDGQRENDRDEQDWVAGESDGWDIAVGHEPERDCLKHCDLGDAAGEGPEQVVFDLVAEFKGSVFAHHIAMRELERLGLGFAGVEIPMQPASRHQHDAHVNDPDLGDPADGEGFGGI